MTNEIRKYIMLIENIILDESFKDAQRKFSTTASSDEVKEYIDKFKELSKRNIIKGQDKDIGTWIKGDWNSFKKFVDSNSAVVTKRQTKAKHKKDSIRVYQDEEKIVVIPLTKEASIEYGKNTSWCTAYTESTNQFIEYFYIGGIILFYVLFRNGDKYACTFRPDDPDTIDCFNQVDKHIPYNEFSDATGVSKNDIQNWYSSNKTNIENNRDLNKVSEEVQVVVVTQDSRAIEHIDNPTEKVQLAAVEKDVEAIKNIDNPTEKVQLAAVKQNGHAIEYIIDGGITPSEQVQLAAVQNRGGNAILFIDNPSEKVQLAAVKENGMAIDFIDNPSEQVQLAAVQNYGGAIGYIIGKGIEPSEAVQLAAVQNLGSAIRYIVRNGITPSETVQLAAVRKAGTTIEHITNRGIVPSEEVKALHNKLWEQ